MGKRAIKTAKRAAKVVARKQRGVTAMPGAGAKVVPEEEAKAKHLLIKAIRAKRRADKKTQFMIQAAVAKAKLLKAKADAAESIAATPTDKVRVKALQAQA